MQFDGLTDIAIYMDQKTEYINLINEDTEIITSLESDWNQFKKENILLKVSLVNRMYLFKL